MRKKIFTVLSIAVMTISIFVLYSVFRQKYVGACDWYAYYSQSQLIKSGQLQMDTELDPVKFPAAAPLGYYIRDGKVIPHFPPGYPLLMAVFGVVGLEFYVTPLLGALTFLLMLLILLKLTSRSIALMFSLLWALSPIVIWGSTSVMSDMAACFFLVLSFYFFTGKRCAYAGLAFGFSLLVRPGNILFILVLLPLLFKQKKWLKFAVCFCSAGLVSGLYNWYMHGAPWKYGIYDTASLLSSSILPENFSFYSMELLEQFTPFLLLLALYGLWKKRKDAYIYGIWFFSFALFYSFIVLGRESWWGIRFLLPALPALFILAALGLKEILDSFAEGWEESHAYIKPTLVIIIMLLMGHFFQYESRTIVFTMDKAKEFYEMAVKVKEVVPSGSLVGAYEATGALRLYGNIESFNLRHLTSFRLIKKQLREKPVYIIKEPMLQDSYFFRKKFDQFDYEKITTLPGFKNCNLYRVKRRIIRATPSPGFR